MKNNDIPEQASPEFANNSLAKPVDGFPLFIGDRDTWSRNLPVGYYANPPIPEGWDHVNFIQEGASGPIKIGYSNHAPKRRKTLQTAHAEELRLIGAIAGDKEVEKAWHSRFAKINIRGEWFRATPELIQAIDEALWKTARGVLPPEGDTR